MHICVGSLTIIGSDNGLPPGRSQAISCTNAGILLIRTLGTNFSEILSEIHIFLFKKMYLHMSSGKCRPFCLDLNVLHALENRAILGSWFRKWPGACSEPSYQPIQCWLLVNYTLRNTSQWNVIWNLEVFVERNAFEKCRLKTAGHFILVSMCYT